MRLQVKKKYGEIKCPHCDYITFSKKQLDGHIGGAHRKGITQIEKPKCKFCNDILIKNDNWPRWAVRQGNIICKKCKNKQNKESYYNTKQKKKEQILRRIDRRNKHRGKGIKIK